MNFIKKKIKGHKRGHESDDEVEAAIYAKQVAERQQEQQQALSSARGSDPFDPFADPSDPSAPGATTASLKPAEDPEEKKRNSEEWRFFEQLTQRVQDTVQKTQDTLTKIKETSAITELNKPDYYLESETLSPEEPAAAVPAAPAKSPARSWVNFEDGQLSTEAPEAASAPSVASKPPPRPPPPSKLVESVVPQEEAVESVQSAEDSQRLNGEEHNVELELLEEFGFAPRNESKSPVAAPVSLDSFLEGPLEDPADDPFDTSFVDVLSQPTPKTKEDAYENAEPEEDDPFDTSFVDVASGRISRTEKTKEGLFSPSELSNKASPSTGAATGTASVQGDMSNPFLVDNAPSTPGESLFGGINGTATDAEPPAEVPNFFSGSRRSSTNPFDNLEEDLEFFRNTLVGGTGETEDASKGAELFEAIASTFPCEGQRDGADQKADLFGFGTADDVQVPKAATDFDPFSEGTFQTGSDQDAGSAFTTAAENQLAAEDPFQVAFGKTSVDHDFSPEKQTAPVPEGGGLFGGGDSVEMTDDRAVSSPPNASVSTPAANTSGGLFDMKDHSPPSTEFPHAMETDAPAKSKQQSDLFGSLDGKAEEHSSFDPFSDLGKSMLEPVPAAVASITPQREDFAPFGLGDAAPCEGDVAPLPAFDAFQEAAASAANDSSNFDPFGNFEDNTSPMETKTDHSITTTQDTGNAFGEFDLLHGEPHKAVTPTKAHDYDPFDTTNIQLEPAKGAVPFTDTAAFEAFAAKFEQAIEKFEDTAAPVAVATASDAFDPFASSQASVLRVEDHGSGSDQGFGGMDIFDPFAVATKPPENTPVRMPLAKKAPSQDSFDDDDVGPDFSVVIRPKMREGGDIPDALLGPPPKLLPPPKSPVRTPGNQTTTASRFNPFDKTSTQKDDLLMLGDEAEDEGGPSPAVSIPTSSVTEEAVPALGEAGVKRAEESAESPSTPLFDEDTSQPLEEFRFKFEGEGWEMMLRHPNKKKITGNRYWKKVFVRMTEQNILYLYNKKEDNDPFQEVPLQACYSLSEVGAQQFDAYGKIFTVKLQYIFYRERMGVRPGQISKVMQGQITSMGQFAKLGLPLEHAPQVSQLLKLGTQCSEDLKTFVQVVEDALFRLQIHRDRALTYKTEEIQVTVQDEFIVEQDKTGHVCKQKARVRIFFLAFITGMPDIEVGVNDLTREGKEVVGRYDIMPVVTEEWIRLENCEFHSCVMQEEFENNRVIKLHPPDACLFELMRFRIRPPRARELPLQLKVVMQVSPRHVELRGDVLVPGYHSRKHGQVACEDIQIRFPIPECWVYLFRVEKHFRYGALKSAARKPGKIKGLERIIGAAQPLDTSLIEVSTGQAKYEHAYRAVVWRIPRLPKEGQGAYTQHLFLLRLDLTSFDQIPESFGTHVDVEFTMPATSVSHTTVRSISVSNENPPEKYVRYLSKHEYRVELDLQTGEVPPSQTEISNLAATAAAQSASFEPAQPAVAAVATAADSDSD